MALEQSVVQCSCIDSLHIRPIAKGRVSRVKHPRKICVKIYGDIFWLTSSYNMHHFNIKTPQITVCCKTTYDIVFILLSVQNSVS